MRTGSVDKWAGEGNSPLLKSKRSRKTGEDGLGSIPISREETRRKDARERDRLPGRGQRCQVTYRGGDVEVEIVNLSGGGAMIAATIVPNLGERLHLHLGADGTVEVRGAMGQVGPHRNSNSLTKRISIARTKSVQSSCSTQ